MSNTKILFVANRKILLALQNNKNHTSKAKEIKLADKKTAITSLLYRLLLFSLT